MWEHIEPGIIEALSTANGEATAQDTKAGLQSGRTQLMLMRDGSGHAGVVFQFLNFPRFKIARVLLLFGGHVLYLREVIEGAERWARDEGCRYVEGWVATQSRVRLFARLGYSDAYTIVRKVLT